MSALNSSVSPLPSVLSTPMKAVNCVKEAFSPMHNAQVATIEQALEAIRKGELVIVMDNEDRENEGDLIAAAEFATEERLAFMVRHSTGIVCVPIPEQRTMDLRLPAMVDDNTEAHKCKFTITVDLREGNTTGVSAADRARTIRALADPSISHDAYNRPGHIFPLKAKEGGVIARAGHTEAAVDLARLAGCRPAGYICEINDDNGKMLRRADLHKFAKEHNLHLITISDLIRYRVCHETLLHPLNTSNFKAMETPFGSWKLYQYDALVCELEIDLLVLGSVEKASKVPVFIAAGEALSTTVDMQWAQKHIMSSSKLGVIIYMRKTANLLEVSGAFMGAQSIFGLAMQAIKQLDVQSVMLMTRTPYPFDTDGFGVSIDGSEEFPKCM